MKNNKITGNFGEQIAKEYLKGLGYKILETNWRIGKLAEIDIIAKDGKTTVFIEVKTRKTQNYGHPFEAIGYHKLKNIYTATMAYMQKQKGEFRVDIIGIVLSEPPKIEHLKNISLG